MSTSVEEVVVADEGLPPIVVSFRPVIDLSDDQFFEFCQANQDLRIEYSEQGELIIMAPIGCESGDRESEIITQLRNWAKRDGTGKTFSSSTLFHLPNGAYRSPDTSWIRLSRWNALSAEQQKKFSPICPDFVIELRSETDRLRPLQAKMQEYINNGAEMGLLVDPRKQKVHIYRHDQEPEVLEKPSKVSCDPVLRGFELDCGEIW